MQARPILCQAPTLDNAHEMKLNPPGSIPDTGHIYGK